MGLKNYSNEPINRENVDADSFINVDYLRPSQSKKDYEAYLAEHLILPALCSGYAIKGLVKTYTALRSLRGTFYYFSIIRLGSQS